jgi:hypothetical protein
VDAVESFGIFSILPQAHSRAPMDASLPELGIHGQNNEKRNLFSVLSWMPGIGESGRPW